MQDHLKSTFAEAGVSSRRELVTDVFLRFCAPHPGNAVGASGCVRTPGNGPDAT